MSHLQRNLMPSSSNLRITNCLDKERYEKDKKRYENEENKREKIKEKELWKGKLLKENNNVWKGKM